MKRIVALFLLFALILPFSSCQNNSNPSNANEGNTLSEEDQIKNSVLDLMQKSKSRKGPTDLFAHFAGDFQITKFTGASPEPIQSIMRRKAVTRVDAEQLSYYGIEASGQVFYAADPGREAEVIGHVQLSADASDASTVFTVFGIDTSALYTATTDSDESESLALDMLTVSDDKTSCQFGKAYLDTIAEEICDAMGFADTQKSLFMKKYTGSGSYSVADNKVSFEIKVKDNQIGTLHQITEYAIDSDGRVYTRAYMNYSNPSAGISTPIITEIECKDVVYRDNDPISATIKLKNSSQSSYRDGSVTVKVASDIETTFQLNCDDIKSRSATASSKDTETETVMGETYTFKYSRSLSIDLGKSTSQFRFTEKQDKETTCSLKADKVTFAASPAIVTPQHVLNAITAYVNNH